MNEPDLSQVLASVGIAICNEDGSYRPTGDILQELSDKWSKIQSQCLNAILGKSDGSQDVGNSRWHLTDSVREIYGPRVKSILDEIDHGDEADELKEFDLSDLGFNPHTLCKYLEELGYEKGTQDDNGWELDFWIPFRKDGHTPIEVFGTGIIFELGIREMDYDWKEKRIKQEEQMSELSNEALDLLHQVKQLLEEGS